MAISAQQLTIYLYSAHRAVIFAIAQLSCIVCVCETGKTRANDELVNDSTARTRTHSLQLQHNAGGSGRVAELWRMVS